MNFTRITVHPNQMGGAPCIRGLRAPVTTIVGKLADGMSRREIVAAYPDLTIDDIDHRGAMPRRPSANGPCRSSRRGMFSRERLNATGSHAKNFDSHHASVGIHV